MASTMPATQHLSLKVDIPDLCSRYPTTHSATFTIRASISRTTHTTAQLLGLIDIAHEKNHLFIRNPVKMGNPDNIPAGTEYNKPDPENARFYPDKDLGGLVLKDPVLGGTVTRYRFNLANPLAGDATPETALGLLMRNAQWMIEVIGADGFRVDAARHMPSEVMNHFDQAVFRTIHDSILTARSSRHSCFQRSITMTKRSSRATSARIFPAS